ncbi:MAG: LysR family transcriptional regulator [Amphritea sp.]
MANIDDIIIFNKIYETGSYTKAATHLNIPKATVSRRVRSLEEKLGVNLINRDTRKISLTEAGDHLYRKTNSLLYKIQEAQESVSELQNEISGDLKITIPVEIGINYINDIICRFLEKHTLIRLEINMTNEVVDIIKDGYDLAIRGGILKDSNLVSKKIIESKLYVCCSPDYLEKNIKPKHPTDLESHTLFSCTYPKPD